MPRADKAYRMVINFHPDRDRLDLISWFFTAPEAWILIFYFNHLYAYVYVQYFDIHKLISAQFLEIKLVIALFRADKI